VSELLLDRAGRRRSPATMPGFQAGRPPRNKGLRYPADPPKVEEIIAVMHAAGDRPHGCRHRGLIVILWRAGLRIKEVLALAEADLDHRRGARLVRRGKGGRRGSRNELSAPDSRSVLGLGPSPSALDWTRGWPEDIYRIRTPSRRRRRAPDPRIPPHAPGARAFGAHGLVRARARL
jgi:integrase